MSRRRIAVKASKPSIERSHIIEDLSPSGTYVRVLGEFGTALAGIYRIRCYATNLRTGQEWLEMTDLKTHAFHAYRVAQTRPATKSEIRRAGLTVPEETP
jgi:hypothetical protein